MPANEKETENTNQPTTTFGSFFQPSVNTENRLLFDVNAQNALRNAEIELEGYQKSIKDQQELIDKIKNALTKGNIPDSLKPSAATRLQSLVTNLKHHEDKFVSLVASDVALQARFRSNR
jgi:hypothetical protein